METLGDDLVLLAIRQNGALAAAASLRYGVSGSELVRLAALGRVGVERGRIVVLDEVPTGDEFLDAALASMTEGRARPTAKKWVARHRGELVRRYLDRLAAAGTIQHERKKALGFIPVDHWTVLDAGRVAAARARLDAVAFGTGPVGLPEVALAGLASAIGLPSALYPGFSNAGVRRRLARAARGDRSAASDAGATREVVSAVDDASKAATRAATDAAIRAATDASIQASIDAATHAAMAAAIDAAGSAHHAADGGGGHVGGHH